MTIYKVQGDKKMAKKYSSFKQQQMITENFRKFMNEEGDDEEYDQADAQGAGVIPAEEQKIIKFIRKVEKGTLENNSGEVIVDITLDDDLDAWQVLADEGIFDAIAKDERVRDYGYLDDDIKTAIQNWIASRGLASDGEIDHGRLEADVYGDYNGLEEEQKPGAPSPEDTATREFSLAAQSGMGPKAWRGANADKFGDGTDGEGAITPAVWNIMLQKPWASLKKNKTKKENKVRFTKRQLQKIIKEEIKKVTKKKK